MNKQLKRWLSQNEIILDNYGRIIIHDESVISEINGAVSISHEVPESFCGAGCDAGCGGCDSTCSFL